MNTFFKIPNSPYTAYFLSSVPSNIKLILLCLTFSQWICYRLTCWVKIYRIKICWSPNSKYLRRWPYVEIVFTEVLKLKQGPKVGPTPTGRVPLKLRWSEPRCTQRKEDVKTRGESGHLQAQDSSLEEHPSQPPKKPTSQTHWLQNCNTLSFYHLSHSVLGTLLLQSLANHYRAHEDFLVWSLPKLSLPSSKRELCQELMSHLLGCNFYSLSLPLSKSEVENFPIPEAPFCKQCQKE